MIRSFLGIVAATALLAPVAVAKSEKPVKLRVADYEVAFAPDAAWTVATLSYRGEPVIVRTGANQTVLNRKVPQQSGPEAFIGTGHGGEEILSITLTADGKAVADPAKAPPAKEYVFEKKSRIGPVLNHTRTVLNAEGLGQTVTITPEGDTGIVRYFYLFMHCFTPQSTEWHAILADRRVISDAFPPEKQNSLMEDVHGFALYLPAWGKGIAVTYPEAYAGQEGYSNVLINWPGRHNKHYFRVKPGQAFAKTYRCWVEVFEAQPGDWKQKATTTLEARQTKL